MEILISVCSVPSVARTMALIVGSRFSVLTPESCSLSTNQGQMNFRDAVSRLECRPDFEEIR
jgi:hypothetical protein